MQRCVGISTPRRFLHRFGLVAVGHTLPKNKELWPLRPIAWIRIPLEIGFVNCEALHWYLSGRQGQVSISVRLTLMSQRLVLDLPAMDVGRSYGDFPVEENTKGHQR